MNAPQDDRFNGSVSFGSRPEPNQVRTADMTLRDYFIAHAPEHPQPWFRPVMQPCPVPMAASDIEATWLREEVQRVLADMVDAETEQAKDWMRRYHEASAAIEAWRDAKEHQRWLQWPAAWADAMLKARSS